MKKDRKLSFENQSTYFHLIKKKKTIYIYFKTTLYVRVKISIFDELALGYSQALVLYRFMYNNMIAFLFFLNQCRLDISLFNFLRDSLSINFLNGIS